MTPVLCQFASLKVVRTRPEDAVSGRPTRVEGDSGLSSGEYLDPAGVELSRRADELRACRRVIPPRALRISSMLWMPSGGLGFLSLM